VSETKEVKSLEDLTTTAAFVVSVRHVAWIRDEAKRRGMNKSELVRALLDQAIGKSPRLVEQEAA